MDLLRPSVRAAHVAMGGPEDPPRDGAHPRRPDERARQLDHSKPGALPMTAAAPARLREIALRQLEQMYDPTERTFVFRRRRENGRLVAEGVSHRYTAISVIGLAREEEATVRRVLRGHSLADVCEGIVARAASLTGIGDVAVSCWAAHAAGYDAGPA